MTRDDQIIAIATIQKLIGAGLAILAAAAIALVVWLFVGSLNT